MLTTGFLEIVENMQEFEGESVLSVPSFGPGRWQNAQVPRRMPATVLVIILLLHTLCKQLMLHEISEKKNVAKHKEKQDGLLLVYRERRLLSEEGRCTRIRPWKDKEELGLKTL